MRRSRVPVLPKRIFPSDVVSAEPGNDGIPFAAAMRASPVAMVIADACREGHPVVFVNDAFSALTGYSPGEIVGKNCRILQGRDTNPGTVAAIGEAIASGSAVEVEILNYRRDGTSFWNALSINPVHDDTGKVRYFLSSQTEAVSPASAGEPSSEEERIERQVAMRTHELLAALDRTTALLREAEHRAKNNLQAVSSLVLLKARRADDEALRQALFGLAERVSALSTMYRLIGASDAPGHFNLDEFVRDFCDELVKPEDDERIALRLDLEPATLAASKGTPVALLVNELVGNALKHAFPGDRSGTLSISVKREAEDLRLVIEDDGIGLDDQPASAQGLGKTLIEMLARQLRARIAWEDAKPGARVTILMPAG